MSVEESETVEASEPADEGFPAWLAKDDEALPEALQAFYAAGLPVGVQILCERGRKMMRDGYVHGLRVVHKALAASGLFKDWCVAVGLNYNTAKSTIVRAQQAAGARKHTRSPAKKPQLVVAFEDDEQKAETVSGLWLVLAAVGVERDDWAFALLVLLGSWEEHQATPTPPEGAAA